MEPFNTRSLAHALASQETERKKEKKYKHTECDANPVPPTAPNYRKTRVPPPPSEFAFPNPITPIAPTDDNDHDMPDVDPGEDAFADPQESELTELERDEALAVQAIAERDAADKRYAKELAAAHAAHEERHLIRVL